jgi:hypothetical protein
VNGDELIGSGRVGGFDYIVKEPADDQLVLVGH